MNSASWSTDEQRLMQVWKFDMDDKKICCVEVKCDEMRRNDGSEFTVKFGFYGLSIANYCMHVCGPKTKASSIKLPSSELLRCEQLTCQGGRSHGNKVVSKDFISPQWCTQLNIPRFVSLVDFGIQNKNTTVECYLPFHLQSPLPRIVFEAREAWHMTKRHTSARQNYDSGLSRVVLLLCTANDGDGWGLSCRATEFEW